MNITKPETSLREIASEKNDCICTPYVLIYSISASCIENSWFMSSSKNTALIISIPFPVWPYSTEHYRLYAYKWERKGKTISKQQLGIFIRPRDWISGKRGEFVHIVYEGKSHQYWASCKCDLSISQKSPRNQTWIICLSLFFLMHTTIKYRPMCENSTTFCKKHYAVVNSVHESVD